MTTQDRLAKSERGGFARVAVALDDSPAQAIPVATAASMRHGRVAKTVSCR